jgi:hypothetical protein
MNPTGYVPTSNFAGELTTLQKEEKKSAKKSKTAGLIATAAPETSTQAEDF